MSTFYNSPQSVRKANLLSPVPHRSNRNNSVQRKFHKETFLKDVNLFLFCEFKSVSEKCESTESNSKSSGLTKSDSLEILRIISELEAKQTNARAVFEAQQSNFTSEISKLRTLIKKI